MPRAAALAALLLAGCAATVVPDAAPRPPAMLEGLLPQDAAGFRRGAAVPLAAGIEVAYATDGAHAAGALVELSMPEGPQAGAGADSPLVQAALDSLLEEALRPVPSRLVQAEARFVLDQALRCVETAGRYGRQRVQGLLCAGVLRGTLLRLRVTMPRREPPPADARAFAVAILAALREPRG